AVQVRADRLGAVSRYVADHYSRPALIPPMAQLSTGRTPEHPVITAAARDAAGGIGLQWRATAQGVPFAEVTSYTVYRVEAGAGAAGCNAADAQNLVATLRSTGPGTQRYHDAGAQPDRAYTYYVTALDRVWNESLPSPGAVVA
ncbi:MAG: glycosyl hydrolase, partial [Micromonosporaceae bacterium]|nr:glycosyl hydrolase [Micromonosporaceae bacterium]